MMEEKIRILLLKNNMSVPDLAKLLKTTSQNIYNKLGRDNFSEKELIKIASAMNAKLEINFITEKGEKI